MSDEVRRIQRMIDDGTVTPEEGRELIGAVAVFPKAQPLPPVPPPVAQQVPVAAVPFRVWWILWPLVGHGLLFLLIYAVLVVIVPRFEEVLKSFGVELPAATRLVLAASNFAKNWALLALPLGAGALALDTLVYALLRRRGWHLAATLWWLAVVMIVLAAVAVIVIGLFLPHVALMERVGSEAAQP